MFYLTTKVSFNRFGIKLLLYLVIKSHLAVKTDNVFFKIKLYYACVLV